MENVNDIKEREITSYSVCKDAGRLYFDQKWNRSMKQLIPKTIKEIFAQLDAMLSEQDKIGLATRDPFNFHLSLGVWIRNNWIYEQKDEDVKHLAELFGEDPIIFHPDDLSDIIIETYQWHLRNTKKIVSELSNNCNRGKRWTKETDEKLREMLLDNKSQREIALELGRSERSIYFRTKELVEELELSPEKIKEQYKSAMNRV